jgi:Uma2 family endonuclease
MQVVSLPEHATEVRLLLGRDRRLSDEAYLAFCLTNPDLRVERSAEGEIIIVPPAGFESSHRNAKVTAQLVQWADKDGRGIAADSSAQFLLADGSALSPDAAWLSNEALRRLTGRQRKGFVPLCPEFVVEVM